MSTGDLCLDCRERELDVREQSVDADTVRLLIRSDPEQLYAHSPHMLRMAERVLRRELRRIEDFKQTSCAPGSTDDPEALTQTTQEVA